MAPSIYSTSEGLLLPLNPGEIRLLKILPHEKDTDTVSCTLITALLVAKPQYTALSYVWGTPENPITISVNGTSSEVTQSLGLALHGIRKSWGEIVLWVDAISINQSDLDEKASQIPLMGEIYRSAERVISWMGQDPATIKKFQDSIETLQKGDGTDEKAILYENGTQVEESSSFSTALLFLGGSEYWKRTWIVQEFVLAKLAVLQSGTAWIDWSVISGWIREKAGAHLHFTTYRMPGNVTGGIKNVISSTKIPVFLKETIRAKTDWQVGPENKHDLLSLMNRHVGWRATNPRDKIWGFLGIANDAEVSFLTKVDYSMPVIVVYHSFAQEVINSQKSVRIIQSAGIGLGHTSQYSGLPSWVPEWSAWDEEDHVLDGDGTLYSASKSLHADFRILDNGLKLQVKGVLFDRVSNARESYRKNLEGDLSAWFLERLGPNPVSVDYVTGIPLLLAFFRTILYDRFEKTHHRLGNGNITLLKTLLDYWTYLRSKFDIKEGLMTVNGDNTTYLSMTLSKNSHHTILYGEADDYLIMALLGRPEAPGSLTEWVQSQQLELEDFEPSFYRWYSTVWYNTFGKSFMLTEKNYIGLAPEGVQVSDVIAIIPGCSVPVILRKQAEHYLLVGECFVQGLMDGEVIDMLGKGEVELQTLEIH